jgi:L-ribulose-5-phosphate 4-epimerase
MAVKATEASFADTSPDAVVISDFAGRRVDGERQPTKECLLHGAIYARRPEVGAIVHCHSPWANGWATTQTPLPTSTYHSRLKLGGPVPVIDTGSYAVPAHLVPDVLAAFDGPPPVAAVILARHGLVAVGRDMKEALEMAELVEETAQVAVIERLLGACAWEHDRDDRWRGAV